jgi:PAS domain S-box-containing protein
MAKQQTTAGVSGGIGGAKQGVKLSVALAFGLIMSAGILFLANKAMNEKLRVTLEHQEKRLILLADSRAQMVNAWLDTVAHHGDRLIKSDLFRLYASEVDTVKGDLASIFGAVPMNEDEVEDEGNELAAQLPMMQNMLREFSTYSGILNARILNRKGNAYIATDGHLPPMLDEQLEQARAAVKSKAPRFSPLRKTSLGIEMDVYVPIFSPEALEGVEEPVGALMMTRQVAGKITELLANSTLSAKGEKTRLIQRSGNEFRQVTPWTTDGFSDVTANMQLGKDDVLLFGERSSLSDRDVKVLSVGVRIAGPEWWIVQEADYDDIINPILEFNSTVYVVAGLGILTALLTAGLAWWILTGVQSQRVAKEFRALAKKIEEQKRFIGSVNANIDEFITVKNGQGKYTYVNDAFANAVGRPRKELLGMDAEAIFGFDTAKRLQAMDDVVEDDGQKVTINASAYIRSRRYEFQISKAPYCDSDHNCVGIVEVYRDMTEFVAAQEKNKRLIQRAMEALGATIEAADPYLGGHTKLLSGLSVEVARAMHMAEIDIAEIETAANLSQIGKMFIPNEVLTKPGKLDSAEKKLMESHVDHAYRILKDIDIAEGVLMAIYQMSERTDGTGYPRQLKEDDMILTARILSALNVFCAMIRPRSYRGAKTPEEALSILQGEQAGYDAEVIAALGEVLKTPTAERLIKGD